MSDTEMDIQFDMPKNRSNVIKVIGVGGGGSNAINHMFEQGITGVDFVVCNTDSQALDNSPVPTKVQLGVSLTEGLGAGANPEIGEQAALESFEDLKTLLDTNTKMVFITAGMGGGTGTGAAPIIAKQARDMEILTVGIVTIPFKFEGRVRIEQARTGVERLRSSVDSLIVIDNNKLREVYGNLGFKSGFSKADEVLATASRGIAEVITHHYTQNIDLRDAKTVLSNSGTAIMGSGIASGADRAQVAITKAMDSPLLNDNKITGAQNVLLLIVSGSEEITLDEIGEINDHIQHEAGNSANIIMGVGEDDDLDEAVSVTIIATGFPAEQQDEIVNTESKKIIHTLEDEQKAVHNLSPENSRISRASHPAQPAASEKKEAPKRIVHSLKEEDFEEEPEPEYHNDMDLVHTSDLIKELEVDYQEVNFDEDDFIFIESNDSFEDKPKPSVSEEKEEEHMFHFDMPKSKESSQKKDTGNRPSPEFSVQTGQEHDPEEIEVQEPIELFPKNTRNEERTTRYSLEDYMEKERELNSAKPPQKEEPKIVRKRTVEEPRVENEPEDIGEIDPLNSPISSELAARASQRRARLKKFNYKFRKNKNIDEIEKQPAYKRAGVDLGNQNDNTQSSFSRSTINNDDDDFQIRSNNSFLHDNVD